MSNFYDCKLLAWSKNQKCIIAWVGRSVAQWFVDNGLYHQKIYGEKNTLEMTFWLGKAPLEFGRSEHRNTKKFLVPLCNAHTFISVSWKWVQQKIDDQIWIDEENKCHSDKTLMSQDINERARSKFEHFTGRHSQADSSSRTVMAKRFYEVAASAWAAANYLLKIWIYVKPHAFNR